MNHLDELNLKSDESCPRKTLEICIIKKIMLVAGDITKTKQGQINNH